MNRKAVLIAVAAAVTIAVIAFLLYRIISSPGTPSGAAAVIQAADAGKRMSAAEQDAAIKGAEETLAAEQDSPKAEAAYLKLASVYAARNDLVRAGEYYRKALEKFPASANVPNVQEALEDLNVRTLFSSAVTPDSLVYKVQKGDSLVKIAKKHGTTVELITRANGLTSPNIRIGQKLKVTKLKFSIVVDKSQNILTLKADGAVFKTYRAATGKPATPTPVGTFTITNKIVDPPWYPPNGKMIPAGDPKNVLGSRWLGISKPSYGIHGTIDPASIGKSVTEGCVRLNNADVEQLYAIVPEGIEVVIVD